MECYRKNKKKFELILTKIGRFEYLNLFISNVNRTVQFEFESNSSYFERFAHPYSAWSY